MKIIIYLCPLVFIPIIVGFGLVIAGYNAGAFVLAFGTPAVMLVLVITGLILLMKGKLFAKKSTAEDPDESEQSQKEHEQAAINAVNDSKFYTNKLKLAEYEADHIVEATKHASKKGFVLGITFFLLLVADAVTATVLTINHIWIGAIVCAALFGASVITGLIAAAIKKCLYMKSDISKAKKIIDANVEFCVMSDMVTAKSTNASSRIKSVVYRIGLCADNEKYEALSKQFYETGETVSIAVMGKKRAIIINENENRD